MKPQAQSYICDLAPYQPGLPIELVAREYGLDPAKIIKLASNENPLGMSPKARMAVQRALRGSYRYPDQYQLLQALAARLGVAPNQIVLGNGSNDVLDLAARTFLNDGCQAISSQYAFAVYQIATRSAGAENVVVPALNYGHDLDAMLAAITPTTRVIWLANPNNPTGTFIPYGQIERFLGDVPEQVLVVLDEAYYEYLGTADVVDSVQWLERYPNLLITRTFSKIYGLAGLRVGYGIAAPQVAGFLNRVRQPFNAGVLGLAGARAALEDEDFVGRSKKVNAEGRKQLQTGLRVTGLEQLPAFGNFITFRSTEAAGLNQKLLRAGIIVRPLAGYGMSDWLRVTIGTKEQNSKFLTALASAHKVSADSST